MAESGSEKWFIYYVTASIHCFESVVVLLGSVFAFMLSNCQPVLTVLSRPCLLPSSHLHIFHFLFVLCIYWLFICFLSPLFYNFIGILFASQSVTLIFFFSFLNLLCSPSNPALFLLQVLFGTADGQVIVMDCHGRMLAHILLHESDGIVSMSWNYPNFLVEDSSESDTDSDDYTPPQGILLRIWFEQKTLYCKHVKTPQFQP